MLPHLRIPIYVWYNISMINPEQEAIYRLFLKWQVRPKGIDDPKSITKFAELHGLLPADIKSFMEHENYYADLLAMSLLWAKSKVPELLNEAYERAKDDKAATSSLERFISLVLELDKNQKAPDKSKGDGAGGNTFIFNVTDDKLNNLANRIIRKTSLPSGSSETGSSGVRTADEV